MEFRGILEISRKEMTKIQDYLSKKLYKYGEILGRSVKFEDGNELWLDLLGDGDNKGETLCYIQPYLHNVTDELHDDWFNGYEWETDFDYGEYRYEHPNGDTVYVIDVIKAA